MIERSGRGLTITRTLISLQTGRELFSPVGCNIKGKNIQLNGELFLSKIVSEYINSLNRVVLLLFLDLYKSGEQIEIESTRIFSTRLHR